MDPGSADGSWASRHCDLGASVLFPEVGPGSSPLWAFAWVRGVRSPSPELSPGPGGPPPPGTPDALRAQVKVPCDVLGTDLDWGSLRRVLTGQASHLGLV